MLLLPLLLSAPSVQPEAGEGVLLVAGPSGEAGEDGWPAEDLEAGLDADVEAEVEAEVGDELAEGEGEQPEDDAPSSTSKPRPKKTATSGSTASTAKRKAPTSSSKAAARTSATAAKAEAAPPPAPPPTTAPPPPPPPPAPAPAPSSTASSDWDRLAVCESGNTNDPGAPYYGYWQFSAATWQSLGQPGLPDQHSRDHQLVVAKRLQTARGWAPWPACSRKLGLK